jgi:hypothetical protein
MADSIINVTSLSATGGTDQIVLRWSIDVDNCLPYLAPDVYEVWASTSNNRGAATKRAEVAELTYTQIGLPPNRAADGTPTARTRYYWVRPKDASGNFGEFYPLDADDGVMGQTDVSGAVAVVTDYKSKILDERNAYYGPNGSLATRVEGVETTSNNGTASGLISFTSQQGEDIPTGAKVSLALEGRIDLDSVFEEAGFYLDGDAANGFTWRLKGRRGFIEDRHGDRIAFFSSDDDDDSIVALFTEDGTLKVGRLEAKSINVPGLIENNVIQTGHIQLGQLTTIETAIDDDMLPTSQGGTAYTQVAKLKGSGISVPDGSTTGVLIQFSTHVFCGTADVHVSFRIKRNGDTLHDAYEGGHVFNGGTTNVKRFPIPFIYVDNPPAGNHVYSVEMIAKSYSTGNSIASEFYQRRLVCSLFKR